MARAHSPTSETPASAPLKKPDLLDQLATRSGLKKRDAKLALDATLVVSQTFGLPLRFAAAWSKCRVFRGQYQD